MILACGGQGFPKVCGTEFIFEFAKEHQLDAHGSMPALCGLETKEDFSSLAGSSVECKTQLIVDEKCIYEDDRVVLFTHWGLSGPAIFNVSLWLGYRYPQLGKNIKVKLSIPSSAMTKRLLAFLKAPKGLKNYMLTASPVAFRGRDECKVMSGGLLFGQVDKNFELKGME